MQKTRDSVILQILSKESELTFNEIRLKGKMGTESCRLGIEELLKKQLIKKNNKTKRYSIRTDTKNKILLETRKQNILKFDLEECMKKLSKDETPFEVGYALIRSAMYDLSKFTLERHSIGLKDNEKYEYDQLIKRCNKTIENTFSVLERIDPYQAMAIKIGIDNATTIPSFELKLEKLATNRQQRRAKKIASKIVTKIA